jgi:acetyltransferase
MRTFFSPHSIAVFGASDKPANLARRIVENLRRFGFSGGIYPIGKGGGSLDGLPIYTAIEEVPDTPELAVLLVPAALIPGMLEACGKKGIQRAIIETGGFSELDAENKSLEERIAAIAVAHNIRFIGPNCFGVINMEHGVVVPFFVIDPSYLTTGRASLISQSGGIVYDTCMVCSVENVGLNKLVSVGNKLNCNENDFLEFLAADPGTGTIGMYLENFSDGRRFLDLALATEKPIVMLKANRGERSREIAHFHTTALAGDDAVTDAAMAQAGVLRVRSFRQMTECFKIFELPLLKGERLALVTRSGGHGVLSADAVQRYGFSLAEFPGHVIAAIKEKKANVIRATNPLDIGDLYDLSVYSDIMAMMLGEPGIDGVVFIVTYSSESEGAQVEEFIRQTGEMIGRYGKPAVLCVSSNRDRWLAMKQAGDVPVFADVDDAMHALTRSYAHYRFQAAKAAAAARTSFSGTARAIPAGGGRAIMDVEETWRLLSRYDLPIAPYAVAESIDDALAAAARIGYPVALKGVAPHILHKTEAGAVALDLRDDTALRQAAEAMRAERYLVQRMAGRGDEVIVGGRQDNEFGPVVLVGLGGIFTEMLTGTVLRVAPIGLDEARVMIASIRGSGVLGGFRGRSAADTESLAQVLVNISRLLTVTENPSILRMEMNPVIVHPAGSGCTIVDARVECAAAME